MPYLDHEKQLAARARYREKHRARINAEMKAYTKTPQHKAAAIVRKAAYDARTDVIARRAAHIAKLAEWARTKAERDRIRKRRHWEENKAVLNVKRNAQRKAIREALGRPERQKHDDPREARRIARKNRQARKRVETGTLSSGIRKKLFFLQGGRCAVCHDRLKTGGPQKYHLDHIEPLALGGPHRDSNMQLLCPPCNVRKGALPPMQFMRSIGNLL